MGWEKRGNQYYYYHKKRKGGRVCSEYVGRGAVAQISVEIIQNAQLGRKTEREALHSSVSLLFARFRRRSHAPMPPRPKSRTVAGSGIWV